MNRYEIIIFWSDEDDAYVADVPELPGCMAHGDTHESALANSKEAIQLWLETAKEFGDPIPAPKGSDLYMHEKFKNEYDFSKMKGGVRGKYYKAYREGHTVKIHKMDGTTVIQHFTLEDGAVMLEPDVRENFPNSEAVNKALRCLIPLLSKKPKSKVEAKL